MEEKCEIGKIRENCSKSYSLVVNSDNTKLFYGTNNFDIKIYDLEKKFILKVLKGHTDCISILKLSKDQKYLFSGANDGLVKIWDIDNDFALIRTINYRKKIFCLFICPSNKFLFIAGSRYKTCLLYTSPSPRD